jgi:hypothetical protein
MQAVVETPGYLADARSAGLTDEERAHIVALVSCQPTAGDAIVGTGGARKIRVAGRGKGKSGGYRVVTFFGGQDIPVFLLAVFGKGDKVNLTKVERNDLRVELAGLADDYRTGRKKMLERIRR